MKPALISADCWRIAKASRNSHLTKTTNGNEQNRLYREARTEYFRERHPIAGSIYPLRGCETASGWKQGSDQSPSERIDR